MFKEIENMKKEDYEYGLQMIQEAKDKYEELKKVLKEKYNGSQMKVIVAYDGKPYKVLNDETREYKEKYNYYLGLTKEKLQKDIDAHYKTLQAKVEKKIGKIKQILRLGGYDYRFIGEQGECGVQVIIAGGYNIQRKHTRWVIVGKDY